MRNVVGAGGRFDIFLDSDGNALQPASFAFLAKHVGRTLKVLHLVSS